MVKNIFVQPTDVEMTSELLSEMIRTHQSIVIQKYQPLKEMYEGQYEILKKTKKEQFKPDNRLTVNFAKYIVDMLNGYFIGIPIKVTHQNDKVKEYLEFIDAYNDQDDNNAELAKICSIYGHGYELVFNDEEGHIGITYLTPIEAFLVYDESISRKPIYAVRYYKNNDNQLVGSFSNKDKIVHFIEKDGILTFVDEQDNLFDGVPMVEYLENEEKQSAFENVRTLINAFNKAISEKANDVDYYADAYLKILGAKLDETSLKQLRDNRILNFEGRGSDGLVVEFLQKPDSDTTQENLLNRIERLIFQISMVANISDENFGESSGIALRYKLQAMDNLARVKERKFVSGMNRRYKLIASFPNNKMNADDWVGISMKFTRNLPANILEESQIAQNLSGIVSEETQLSVLSIVDDTQAEMQKKEPKIDDFKRGGVNGTDERKDAE